MRLKTASIYLLIFLSQAVMFSVCYYLSYEHALNDFNKKAIVRNDNYVALEQKPVPTQVLAADDNQTQEVAKQPSDTILPTTKYVLETFDRKTNTLNTEELNPPAYLVGLTKEEVVDYLSDYMKDMSLSEHNKGLISFELLNFSSDRVILRKTYDEDSVAFRFLVVVEDGYVVVYYSDLKSIFNYTHIEAKNLSEDDRIKLSQGIYIKSEDELYSLLESYSS
ncbi:MAG TPA: BofC C-terminal domain-containing protein [Mobilitalea sp.]|nr:BofC C-terminal domain-containing protein [Mobilitalea sp.]